MTQSEALRLADELDELDRQFSRNGLCGDAAAELRRLAEVEAQRDALLEALRGVMSVMPTLQKDARHIVGMEDRYKEALVAARAAIKKAEEA